MSIRNYAKLLGSRGGLARARRLSPHVRKKIAAAGGHARLESISAAKKIEENFRYLDAMHEMTPPPKVCTSKGGKKKLPGIYV